MAVPARKVSKTSQRTRRAHVALKAKATTTCPKCGEVVKPHRVCPKCGNYKDRQVIKDESIEETENKEKKSKKESKEKK